MTRLRIGRLRGILGFREGQTVGSLPVQTGQVSKVDGSAAHWRVNEDRCVEIGVELDDGRTMWVEGNPWGGATRGVYYLPEEGDEVAVAFPDEGDGFLLAVYPTGGAPEDLQPGRVLVIGAEVLIYSEDGAETDQLVRKSAYEAHKHGSGVGPTTEPDNALDPTSYTSVLKAE